MLLDGYVRVSQARERKKYRPDQFISPQLQRSHIAEWASSRGVVLGNVYEELDQSGGRWDRPLLEEAVRRVEEGRTDGIVVAKLNRFGRSLLDGLGAIRRIQEAGGTFVSVLDDVDLKTPTGRLVVNVLFSVAEWELEQARQNWDQVKANAVARGIHISSVVPLGYIRGKDRRLYPDPSTAPRIVEAFRLRASGWSGYKVAAFLNSMGLKTSKGHEFTANSIYQLMRKRAYLGEVSNRPHVNPDAHEALVDPVTWQEAQTPPPKPQRSASNLLTRIMRCAGCGRVMYAEPAYSERSPSAVYRCLPRRRHSEGLCPAPASIRADEIEPLVEGTLFRLARARESAGGSAELRRCSERVAKEEAALAAYRDNSALMRRLGSESFEEGIVTRQRRLEKALLALGEARRAVKAPSVRLDRLQSRWLELSIAERRAAVCAVIDVIAVKRGIDPASQRVWFYRRGEAPPRTRHVGGEVDPLDRGDKARRFLKIKLPSEQKLQAALAAFTADRTDWPTYRAFAGAGLALTHHQMMQWGGPHYWAAKLGLRIPKNFVLWDEERVRGALRPILCDRPTWPTPADFDAAGLGSLRRAIRFHGGIRRWAAEFQVSPPPQIRDTWPMKRVERELLLFLGGRRQMPTSTDFARAGRDDLLNAVRGHGGRSYWIARLGLKDAVGYRKRRQCGAAEVGGP